MNRIADLKAPGDPQGRTYQQINEQKKHNIPIGALVELDSGARLFVVNHTRDCDGTPLYYLAVDREDTKQERKGFRNPSWVGGYSEASIVVVA